MNRVAPELAYGVSALAQLNTSKVGEVTVNHAKELDKLVQRLKMLKNSGGGRLNLRKLNMERWCALPTLTHRLPKRKE